ncbi:MAG: nucleoside deaminase [Haloferacaceae archaeon]
MTAPDALDALDHDRHVRRAIDLAREAGERGDPPYGSLLVRDGAVVAEARNRERTDGDIALHPELSLARRAAREADPAERARTVMYTSTEPCPMCASGVAVAGLGAVVFSVSADRARRDGRGAPALDCATVLDAWDADAAVRGPVLPGEGIAVHEEYPAGD